MAEYIAERKITETNTAEAGVACEGAATEFDLSQTPVFQHWGLEAGASHYMSPSVARVTGKNIASLALDWAFAYPDASRARSQPAFGAGALFVGSQSGLVYAFDMDRLHSLAISSIERGAQWTDTPSPGAPLKTPLIHCSFLAI